MRCPTCGFVSYDDQRICARWVGYLVSSIVLYIGFFWVMVDYSRQGWHDKIADTYVIKV